MTNLLGNKPWQGYKLRFAMPGTKGEVHAVLQHLDKQWVGLEHMLAALFPRDGFLSAVFWQSKSSWCNDRVLRLEDRTLPAGRNPTDFCMQYSCCQISDIDSVRFLVMRVKMRCPASTMRLPHGAVACWMLDCKCSQEGSSMQHVMVSQIGCTM